MNLIVNNVGRWCEPHECEDTLIPIGMYKFYELTTFSQRGTQGVTR